MIPDLVRAVLDHAAETIDAAQRLSGALPKADLAQSWARNIMVRAQELRSAVTPLLAYTQEPKP